jgi:hypothetical protein
MKYKLIHNQFKDDEIIIVSGNTGNVTIELPENLDDLLNEINLELQGDKIEKYKEMHKLYLEIGSKKSELLKEMKEAFAKHIENNKRVFMNKYPEYFL